MLTSMTDAMRYPSAEMVEMYSHRWEIEMGYREIKQTIHNCQYHLGSKKPEMVKQELWGILLRYNILRYQMIKMAQTVKRHDANQLSFASCSVAIIGLHSQNVIKKCREYS